MQVGWIDFSAEDRSRTLTVLSSLNEPGSVDELGIGIVRDAMADVLFPGTSTLLTKARYFFLVPYISRFLEEGHDDARQDPRVMRNRFRDLERACAEGLCNCERENSGTDEGIIGHVALSSGKWVTRGPGELYWASLRALGFMRPDSPESYQAQFAYLADARTKDALSFYDGPADASEDGRSDDRLAYSSMWKLPRDGYSSWKAAWKNWKTEASIALTKQEARFLRDRIVATQPDSLYALILSDGNLRKLALATAYGGEGDGGDLGESSFHAFLDHGLARIAELSQKAATTCAIADAFSEFVLGCRIAYNMQIAGVEEEAADEWEAYEGQSAEAAGRLDLTALGAELGLLEHAGFQTMSGFLARARNCMLEGDLEGLKNEVARREAQIKGTRRKIGRTDLGEFAWRGGRRLPYRFANAIAIVREIEEAGGCDA